MRKPSQTETSIQSWYTEENQTGNRPRKLAERPTPTKKRKRYNIIPHIIALSVILATNRSAYAISLSFNLNTDLGDVTNGTLTLTDNGPDQGGDGFENYVVEDITGTIDGTPIKGVDPNFFVVDNQVEVDASSQILTDGEGIGFDDSSNDHYEILYGGVGAGQYGPPDGIYEFPEGGTFTTGGVSSFTESAPTTPVPFQAPLADAIPVIGSVLVLGALRKVRNFKKA